MKKFIVFMLVSILLKSSLFAITSQKARCDFWNQQYDKYSRLAENAPNASVEKLEFIRKLDFYDTEIFNDPSCDLQRRKDFVDTDIINNILDGI